jgi:hypothetical protein
MQLLALSSFKQVSPSPLGLRVRCLARGKDLGPNLLYIGPLAKGGKRRFYGGFLYWFT